MSSAKLAQCLIDLLIEIGIAFAEVCAVMLDEGRIAKVLGAERTGVVLIGLAYAPHALRDPPFASVTDECEVLFDLLGCLCLQVGKAPT